MAYQSGSMGRVSKAVRVADRAINTLLQVQDNESVLIITDESGMEENQEIIEAMLGLSREIGANTNLLQIRDVAQGVEFIPEEAKRAMDITDVLIGATKTTAASVIHHDYPVGLRKEGKLRGLYMVKRSYDALTSPCVLEANYEEMIDLAKRVSPIIDEGSTIEVYSERGTDLTASLEGMDSKYSDFAHQAGDLTGISWGEVAQGPTQGTAEGNIVIDGPILEYGWPRPQLELEVENGLVTDITGDESIAEQLLEVVEQNENAGNLAEISFGTNPVANLEETNIWKKGRGRTHVAIGNGLGYGQPVKSPVHIDFVMNKASVKVDGQPIINEGTFVV